MLVCVIVKYYRKEITGNSCICKHTLRRRKDIGIYVQSGTALCEPGSLQHEMSKTVAAKGGVNATRETRSVQFAIFYLRKTL